MCLSERRWAYMKIGIYMYMYLSSFLGLKHPLLNLFNFLRSRALLFYNHINLINLLYHKQHSEHVRNLYVYDFLDFW